MPDYYKYTALTIDTLYVAINHHDSNYADRSRSPGSNEDYYANNTLRVYRYSYALDELELIAEGLKDMGTTSMKATSEFIFIVTGEIGLPSAPVLQVIDLSDNSVAEYPLDTKIQEVLGIT